jgi:hypothetical protein
VSTVEGQGARLGRYIVKAYERPLGRDASRRRPLSGRESRIVNDAVRLA